MTDSECLNSISKACKELIISQPFYGIFSMMLNKRINKTIPTACVGLQGVSYTLDVNPKFWKTLTQRTQIGLIQHEILHIIEFHLTDFNHLSDEQIANEAMDIHINQFIPDDLLPPDGCTISKYPQFANELKRGTQFYYDELMKSAQSKSCPNVNAIRQASSNNEEKATLPNGQGQVRIPKHDWEVEGESKEAANRILKVQTEKLIREVADHITKSRGIIPGHIQKLLERLNIITPPKFDWKGYIRRFIGNSTQVYTKKSRRKLNLRFPTNPGQKVKQHRHVLIAFDTSASVSTNELKEFQNEMLHIQRNNTEVTLVQADTAISHVGKLKKNDDIAIHGRGGTDFQPVIDYYNENQRKYNCLIYMTDGEAPNPENVRGNVLWVLSEQSNKTTHLTGRTIQLEL